MRSRFEDIFTLDVTIIPEVDGLVGWLVDGGLRSRTVIAGEDTISNNSMANATPIKYGHEINAALSSSGDINYCAVNATISDSLIPRLHLTGMFKGGAI